MTPDEKLDLPVHDVDAATGRRIRTRAASVFVREARLAQRPWLGRADRVYEGLVEPLLVTGLSVAYLGWAFARTAWLLLG